MKKSISLLLGITLICTVYNYSYGQETSRAQYVSAREYIKIDSLNLALAELDSALKLSPKFAEEYLLKGEVLELKKEDRKALGQYSLAILNAPTLTNAYLKRAALHFKLKDHRNYVLNDVNKAIELNPGSANLYALKAYYTAHTLSPADLKPDYTNAIIAINKAVRLAPKDASYLKLRSEYKFNNGQNLAALADINSAIVKVGSNDSYYHFRGVISFTMGNFRSALIDITTAIELNSSNYSYHQLRGNIYYNLKRYNEAYNDYTSTIQILFGEVAKLKTTIKPNSNLNVHLRETHLLRGMALVQENKPHDGCDDFKRALQMGDRNANNYIRQYCL